MQFGGKPGEPVSEVDPADVKLVWQVQKDAQDPHRGMGAAIGADLIRKACTPGADIEAVGYRTMLLWMMDHIAPEELARFMRDGEPEESVFRAAAKIPVEWMGVGIARQGPPFDVNEFLRLCATR
jgi:hypothetical protein